MGLPYKVGFEVDSKKHNLNDYMYNSDEFAFYIIKINLHKRILIKIGKTRNAGQRFRAYMRNYDGDKKITVLRLFIFRKSHPDKSFQYDYKRMIAFCDEFETQIIRKIKDLSYYNTEKLSSVEYYKNKDLDKINEAIDEYIKSVIFNKTIKELKLRKGKRVHEKNPKYFNKDFEN